MSKKRTVLKFGLAGVLTTLYGVGAYRALNSEVPPALDPEKLEKAPEWMQEILRESNNPLRVAIAAGTAAAMTWMIALL